MVMAVNCIPTISHPTCSSSAIYRFPAGLPRIPSLDTFSLSTSTSHPGWPTNTANSTSLKIKCILAPSFSKPAPVFLISGTSPVLSTQVRTLVTFAVFLSLSPHPTECHRTVDSPACFKLTPFSTLSHCPDPHPLQTYPAQSPSPDTLDLSSVLTSVTLLKRISHVPPKTLTTPHQKDKSPNSPAWHSRPFGQKPPSGLSLHFNPQTPTHNEHRDSLLPPPKRPIHFHASTYPAASTWNVLPKLHSSLKVQLVCHLHYGKLLQHQETSLAAPSFFTLRKHLDDSTDHMVL